MTSEDNRGKTESESLDPEEDIRASDQYDEWFNALSPLQQSTQILMEKICALNMGVTGALVGFDSTETLRIVAEDLKIHIERFLAAIEEQEAESGTYL